MKKSLLTLAALLAATAGFAQSKDVVALNQSKKVTEFSMADKHYAPQANDKVATKSASRRVFSDGVWYARPEGSYWMTGTTSSNESYEYLVVPPFTQLRFQNMSATATTWSIGTNDLTEYTDGNDLVYSFNKITPGYVMYTPTITSNNTTYQVADYVVVMDSVPMTVHPFNYAKGKRYYGYNNGDSPLMSGADQFDFDGDGVAEVFYPYGFRQYFDKPASPMRLNEVTMWITTKTAGYDGKDLYLVINKVDRNEDGKRIVGEEIAKMECSNIELMDEYLTENAQVYAGDITFAKLTEDEFGTQIAEPVLLNEEFVITLMGVNKEGVDVRLYFTDQGESEEEFETWATPTYILPGDAEGNHLGSNPNGLSYWNETQDGTKYCYSAVFFLNIEMDGIEVLTSNDLNQQIAPAEGGETGAASGYPAYVFTNYPFFEGTESAGNYGLSGVPEWASVKIDPTGYEYEIGTNNEVRGLHNIWFEVEPLPAGEKGRWAAVYVESAFNWTCSTPIFILQGDAEIPAGVKTIKFDANGKFVATYNMNGQRVNANAKGLVINNGKKFFNK